jgi:hypothetical protein
MILASAVAWISESRCVSDSPLVIAPTRGRSSKISTSRLADSEIPALLRDRATAHQGWGVRAAALEALAPPDPTSDPAPRRRQHIAKGRGSVDPAPLPSRFLRAVAPPMCPQEAAS